MNPSANSQPVEEPPPQLSVVVPVFRSERSLRPLVERLLPVLASLEGGFEIVFVEDGGGDGSWGLIEELSRQHSCVRGLQLARNYGQHNALLCGIRAARGTTIVTMDDDLQNPPEEIPTLLARLAEGADVVYGYPIELSHGFFRNQASLITKLVLRGAMGVESASKVSAFRAFRTRVREAFESYRSPSVHIDVLLTWGTSRFDAVAVRQDARTMGESGYTLRKLIAHAVNMMTGFSVLPLQIASVLGLVFGVFGMVVLGYVLLRYLTQGSSVPGFAFLASIIAIFSGVQLFALGIFGEYLARMHFRSMERPPYALLGQTDAEEAVPRPMNAEHRRQG